MRMPRLFVYIVCTGEQGSNKMKIIIAAILVSFVCPIPHPNLFNNSN